MIRLAPGYTGFTKIDGCLKSHLGSKLGEEGMTELFVYGSNRFETIITLSSSLPNIYNLKNYLENKMKINIGITTNSTVANTYWLSLAKALRENTHLSSKVIIITYSTLNNLLTW